MKKGDFYAGLVLLCFSALLVFQSHKLPSVSGLILGPGSLPTGLGIVLAVLSLILIIQSFNKKIADKEIPWPKGRYLWRAILIVLSFCFYIAAVIIAGYTLSTFAFMVVLMRLMRSFKWKTVILTSFCITFCFYFVFKIWLEIPLPEGFIGI